MHHASLSFDSGYNDLSFFGQWDQHIAPFSCVCMGLVVLGLLCGWLVGFVALRPKSTAMVIAGRSVHLTTLFPGQA